MLFKTFQHAIVRIYSQTGNAKGLGHLIEPDLVLTCAHVVSAASGTPARFPVPLNTVVQLRFWQDEERAADPTSGTLEAFHGGEIDLALLRLPSPITDRQPLPLLHPNQDQWGDTFRAFGIPKSSGGRGQAAQGTIQTAVFDGALQIKREGTTGFDITYGYSGGPLWNHRLQGVVGVIFEAEAKEKQSGVAYAIPTAEILKTFPKLPVKTAAPPTTPLTQVERELSGAIDLNRLRLQEFAYEKWTQFYTDLSGHTQKLVEANQDFRCTIPNPWGGVEQPAAESYPVTDVIGELLEHKQAVLLGDPGSGKTTTLLKLALKLTEQQQADPAHPIPLLLRMGDWRQTVEPTAGPQAFWHFAQQQSGALAPHLDQLLRQQKVALLLDGLNEMPTAQLGVKAPLIQDWLDLNPDLLVISSCRTEDFKGEHFKRFQPQAKIEVRPLKPLQVRDYVCRYLGHEVGQALFWQMGGSVAQELWQKLKDECDRTEWVNVSDDRLDRIFWEVVQKPAELTHPRHDKEVWSCYSTSEGDIYWHDWVKERDNPAGLLYLARNPYMLYMLVNAYWSNQHQLPDNRGQLFEWFVDHLIDQEKARQLKVNPASEQAWGLLKARLIDLAWQMQTKRAEDKEEGSALTTLEKVEVDSVLTADQLYLALSAGLLDGSESIRFSHQLLQEYFVAQALDHRIFAHQGQPLDPTTIWHPDRWWEPTNWEEAVILLAGLKSDDCSAVVHWLINAQPELAARCMLESGAHTPEETKLLCRQEWKPRLTDIENEPEPKSRAAVGRAIGMIRMQDGTLLDDRPGVGVYVSKKGIMLPDLEWGKLIPAGKYMVGGDPDARLYFNKKNVSSPLVEVLLKSDFQLAQFPITVAQFATFVNCGAAQEPLWWNGIPEGDSNLEDQIYFKEYLNHPRQNITWFQAVAYCRWLSVELGKSINLPHEHEWEVAARSPDQRFYPYGVEYDSEKANTERGINLTSAVGIYPHGANLETGLYDMSGNVWEWSQNKITKKEEKRLDDNRDRRVLRGGSWLNSRRNARLAFRSRSDLSSDRFHHVGFRLVRRYPIG